MLAFEQVVLKVQPIWADNSLKNELVEDQRYQFRTHRKELYCDFVKWYTGDCQLMKTYVECQEICACRTCYNT